MYTSWNRAIEIVIGTNLVACFLFLFCIMIAMGIFELHYEHYAQCLLFTAILFSVAFISMMIHGIYIRRKISRDEVRRVEVHFDNFKIGACIVSYSGVIVNLMVCCFGTDFAVLELFWNRLTGSLCGVCYRTYSDSSRKKTPRILKECGHTICEGCAGRILKANYSSYLPCSFCRKKTRVDSVTKLPKNYGMLQMLNVMNPMESFNNSKLYENPKLKRRKSFS
ncbi:hypothetical protein L5515_005797 [Caenorhabditis briggsae]|uniref:RING-type domain-containing protein n=1 Tax=Caenorhabditis briggsae TaxID=6238 RepID=A0AAE9JIP5_CAEBR|nr:hypothetical protein L5515_005797 [Caenorhabditis briggsae]